METDKYHVYLLSNVKSLAERNTNSDFITILATPIVLDQPQSWHCSLVEAIIRLDLQNLRKEDLSISVIKYVEPAVVETLSGYANLTALKNALVKHGILLEGNKLAVPIKYQLEFTAPGILGLPKVIFGDSQDRWIKVEELETCPTDKLSVIISKCATVENSIVQLTEKSFKSEKHFIEHLNGVLQQKAVFALDQKISCKLNESHVLHVSDRVSDILGYREQSIQISDLNAEHEMDLYPGSSMIFIYCSLCSESQIGDASGQILRILPLNRESIHKTVPFSCYPPTYKNIIQREISSIRISLRNEIGELLNFGSTGKVALCLELKKKKDNE
jgi:hypothetical protein